MIVTINYQAILMWLLEVLPVQTLNIVPRYVTVLEDSLMEILKRPLIADHVHKQVH